MMPQIRFSAVMYGKTACPDVFPTPVTISGVAGDQQASLYGQLAYSAGQTKVTYGTGCFVLFSTWATSSAAPSTACCPLSRWIISAALRMRSRALSSMPVQPVQWLRDGLGIITTVEESEAYATSVPDSMGVYVVPAFTGMGAPYWNMSMRGSVFGLTRGTARHHVIRATLESIAYQTADVLDALTARQRRGYSRTVRRWRRIRERFSHAVPG